MSDQRVWLRFEKQKKDGSTWKLRIQDMPPARVDELIDLQAYYFSRDTAINRAAGVPKNPAAVQEYKEEVTILMCDPTCRTVICCEDSAAEVGDIIGISCVTVGKQFNCQKSKENVTAERKKYLEVTSDIDSATKVYKSGSYLHDISILVMPNYRGYGIAQQFLKTRRIMCAELGIPLTGALMTGYGTQVAGTRDGWRTVFEAKTDDLAKKYDLVFEDTPPTFKYMEHGSPEGHSN